jgi:multiple sugar transport system substrate-binding protein
MSKSKLFILGTIIALVALSACGGGAPATEPGGEVVPPEEVVNLRLGVDSGMAPPIIEVIQAAIEDWNAANPGIQVVVEVTPEYWVKIPSAFASGTAPDIIYNTVTETTSTFAELGMYLDLDDYIAASEIVNPDDFEPGIWSTAEWNGGTWVVPYAWTDLGITYNKAMFDAAGLDYPEAGWTWDEFLATAKALTVDTTGDGVMDQWGFAMNNWPYLGLFPFIMSNGGEILSADKTEVLVDSEAGMEAIKFYLGLVHTEKVAPTALDLGENPNPFATGVVAMELTRSFAPYQYGLINPDLAFGVTSIPMKTDRVNYFEGSGFGINSKSEFPDEAWKVIEFLASPEHQLTMAEQQIFFPARTATLSEVEYTEQMQAFLAEKEYGRDLQVVAQFDTLTSHFFFYLIGAVGGVDPINIDADIPGLITSAEAALALHPIK